MNNAKQAQIVNKAPGARIRVPLMHPSALAFFREQGRIGGSVGGLSRSPSKVRASRQNGKKGGRPKRQALPKSKVLASIQGSKDSPLQPCD
jgi:hypothetical protein